MLHELPLLAALGHDQLDLVLGLDAQGFGQKLGLLDLVGKENAARARLVLIELRKKRAEHFACAERAIRFGKIRAIAPVLAGTEEEDFDAAEPARLMHGEHVGILHAACQQSGLPSASLWAAVPHYIAATPNPKAALALVRKLEGLVGVSVDAEELERSAADYERQVSLAVQSDPDVQAFVERLEQAQSDEPGADPGALPSGETIARDLQRFLRQRGDDPPGSGPARRE